MVLENTENLQSRAGRDFWWLANYIFWHFNIFVYKCKFENENKKKADPNFPIPYCL